MNRLDGKVALISGASRGIGAKTAELMVAAGAKVIVADVLDDTGQETAKALGADAAYIHLDVTKEADWRAAVELAESKFGGLDVLCNNAGVMAMPDRATGDGYDVQMQTNHLAHFLLTKEVFSPFPPHFPGRSAPSTFFRQVFPLLEAAARARGDARVVNHSSIARRNPAKPLEARLPAVPRENFVAAQRL